MGTLFGYLLGGAVILESLFGFTGMGQYLVDAVNSKDFISLQASLLVVGALSLLVFLLVDLVNMFLDPRRKPGVGGGSMTNMLAGAPESAHHKTGQEQRGRSRGHRRMTRAGLALGLTPAAILVIIAVIGPLVAPYTPTKVAGIPSVPPGSQFWFGTTPRTRRLQPSPGRDATERLHRRGLDTAGQHGRHPRRAAYRNERIRSRADRAACPWRSPSARPPTGPASHHRRPDRGRVLRRLDDDDNPRDQHHRDAAASPPCPHRGAPGTHRGLPRAARIAG